MAASWPTGPSGDSIILENGQLKVNNATIDKAWSLSSFKAGLNEPSRYVSGVERIHLYDAKGIMLMELLETDSINRIVHAIKCYLSHPIEGDENRTTGLFTGTVKIDKTAITVNMTPDQVKQALSSWTVSDKYEKYSVKLSKDGMIVFIQYNEPRTKIEFISIWQAHK